MNNKELDNYMLHILKYASSVGAFRAVFVVIIGMLSIFFSGCDPVYMVHYKVNVRADNRPADDAWVLLKTDCNSNSPVRTNIDGLASIDAGGFLCSPLEEPVFIYKHGERLRVAIPGLDFEPKGRGLFFHTVWDANVEVAFPLITQSGIDATCLENGQYLISFAINKTEWCRSYLVEFSPSRALIHSELSNRQESKDHSIIRVKFFLSSRTDDASEIFFIAMCHSADSKKIRVVTSDALSDPRLNH